MKRCIEISNSFCKNLTVISLVIFTIVITLPVTAQQSLEGTGHVWRNLELRPLNCTFSPDGSQLACGSFGMGAVENIAIVDAKSGDVKHSFGKNEFGDRQVELMAWSNDGTKLAVVTNYMPQSDTGRRGVVYEVDSGKIIRVLDLENVSRVSDVAFTGNEQQITAVAIPNVYHWSVATDDPAEIVRIEMDNYGGESVKIVPGTNQLVTGGTDAFLWDAATGKQIRQLQNDNSDANARFIDFAVSSDGGLIAGTKNNFHTIVWNRESGQQHANFELDSESSSQSSLAFIGPDLLSLYIHSTGKVHMTQIPSGKSVLTFDAPQAGSSAGMAWSDEHFVFANLQRQPVSMRILCRGTTDCGKEEGITPQKMEELLPSSVAGLEQAAVTTRWGEQGPSAQAMYGNMDRGMEMEVNITSKAEIQKIYEQMESRLEQEGTFKKTYKNYTVYGGGNENSRGMVLLLENSTVMLEGNLEMEQMMNALEALPLAELQALVVRSR